MNRIARLFQDKDRDILSVYFTAGVPSLQATGEIIRSLESSGADMVEIGIPFSDPMADGAVIQESSARALRQGMTLSLLLEQVAGVRSSCRIPLILMGYLNPVMQYGVERFFEKCRAIGIDGLIIPDLPFQEYRRSFEVLGVEYDLPVIMLITPETEDERIRLIDEHCGGFIYMVSSASTTGVKERFTEEQLHYFERVDRMGLKNKRLTGFGVSNPETFSMACRYSNGAIVGSLFVRELMEQEDVGKAVERVMQRLGVKKQLQMGHNTGKNTYF